MGISGKIAAGCLPKFAQGDGIVPLTLTYAGKPNVCGRTPPQDQSSTR